jgi:hypothetical protein
MLGLVDGRAGHAGRKGLPYPERIANYILHLKRRYPPIHYREIVRILDRKFTYKTNHVSVKRFLDQQHIPVQLALDFSCSHTFKNAYNVRWEVIILWVEGWNKTSIAGCLHLSRRHVGRLIDTFQREGFAGLEDQRTRSPDHPANQLTLPFLKDVLDIQKEYPRAGRFRVRGLLEQKLGHEVPSETTIGRAMAKNRQFHGAPGPWNRSQDAADPDSSIKTMPYQPEYPHHIWFIDLRYLVKLDGHWIYSICVIDGYSRVILAGMASLYQDLPTVLQILFAAVSEYGCPEMIVSDNGTVFTAHQYNSVLNALAAMIHTHIRIDENPCCPLIEEAARSLRCLVQAGELLAIASEYALNSLTPTPPLHTISCQTSQHSAMFPELTETKAYLMC